MTSRAWLAGWGLVAVAAAAVAWLAMPCAHAGAQDGPPPGQVPTPPPGYAPPAPAGYPQTAPPAPGQPPPPPAPQPPQPGQYAYPAPQVQYAYPAPAMAAPVAPPRVLTPAEYRQGFTLEVGGGLAWMSVPDAGVAEIGLDGLTLSLGGFVSQTVAILVRFTGATVFQTDVNVTAGGAFAAVQVWANDWFTLGGGLGACTLNGTPLVTDRPGFALDARLGAAFARWNRGQLRGALELMSGWVGGSNVTVTSLAIEWQYY